MVKLAANLSLMFGEMDFLERFSAASRAGFEAVEFMFPYEVPAQELAEVVTGLGLTVALFNAPAGDWSEGDRGIAATQARVEEFRTGLDLALHYARALRCGRVHVMAGKAARDVVAHRTLVENVRFAAESAAMDGIEILLEPINTRVDIPGYFYDTSAAAMGIIAEVDRPNVKLQYDIYHMQIMEGDLARSIERLLPSIGHIQIADNPGRNEPGTGEIAFPWLLDRLDALGYDGYVGCEYRPKSDTVAGLAWAERYLGA